MGLIQITGHKGWFQVKFSEKMDVNLTWYPADFFYSLQSDAKGYWNIAKQKVSQ